VVHEKPHFVVEYGTVLDHRKIFYFVGNDASRLGFHGQCEKGAFVEKLLDVLLEQLIVQIEVRTDELNSGGTANEQVRLLPIDKSVVGGDLVGYQRVRVRGAHACTLSSEAGSLNGYIFEAGNLVCASIFEPKLVHKGVDDLSEGLSAHVYVVHGLGVQTQLVRPLQGDHMRAITVDEGTRRVQSRATGLFASKLSCSRVNGVEVRPRTGCR
jgi:hypothetical protein